MKYLTLLLFIFLSSHTQANDGEYRCNLVQKFNYQNLSKRVLNISYHIDKVKELEKNGLRTAALNIITEGHRSILEIKSTYRAEDFCYSLEERATHQINLLVKHQIELSLLEDNLKKFNDCSYAILKLEEETSAIVKEDEFYGKFIATSKTITKADLIRKDSSCNSQQQEKLTTILNSQNDQLTTLYQGLEKS